MPHESLTTEELIALIARVFQPRPADLAVGVMIDLPDAKVADNPDWTARRAMAAAWVDSLRFTVDRLGLPVHLVAFRNAHMNNADLPDRAWLHEGPLPALAEDLDPDAAVAFDELFASHRIWLAPTEFSATAPLKLAAAKTGIRAATMPGFSADMIPSLKLDYAEVNRRVDLMTDLLTRASGATFDFDVAGGDRHHLDLDLRHRSAHASGGLFPRPGAAGNLPSGESYIVPYEGEVAGDPSGSAGRLPVELDGEVVVYRIEANRAVAVEGQGPVSEREADRLRLEPAYGNLAELGLGVLADFGLSPIGETLLDEKLGLHIAFGRSDHFGGQVGAAQFSSPDAVVHIDRVYIPQIQPKVSARAVDLLFGDAEPTALIRDGRYVVSF